MHGHPGRLAPIGRMPKNPLIIRVSPSYVGGAISGFWQEYAMSSVCAMAGRRCPWRKAPLLTTTPSGGFTSVRTFLIAINDQGQSGPAVGCVDSVVGVVRNVPLTEAPLRAALQELLSLKQQVYGQSGLYDALYQSDLTVGAVTLVNGDATAHLGGKLMLGGECDNPRVQAQLENTALQFPTVLRIHFFINGVPLQQVLPLK
jgi:hypothetical protein